MNRLVSVNVGLPCDVEWQGQTVHTAIWKRPVPGRVMARRLNLDGDGQGDLAAHGGEHRAVMVYQRESYRYWAAYLQRHDFEYGQFGGNLTVTGLPDDEVCIGDRYRIGEALFEVTQPRVTCARVGLRMDNPLMPSLLVSHKRPGFYFRVLQEGDIGAGDMIVKVADGPGRVTVAEVDALLYLPGHPRGQMQRALRVPALSAGWKEALEDLVASDAASFRPLRVSAIRRESADVLSFVLEAEDGSPLPVPIPGQFLVFKLTLGGQATPLLRSYSISGTEGGRAYRVSVKQARGPGSRYFHQRVQAGALLQVSAPKGRFTLASGTGSVILLSAGIGVTPLLSMRHSLAGAGSTREVWWCHGARSSREHLFAAEVQDLLRRLPRSHAFVAYSDPGEQDQLGRDYDASGHLSLSSLLAFSPVIARDAPKTGDFYLCGPPALLADFTEALQSWGVPATRIHSETFGAGAALTPGAAAAVQKTPHLLEGDAGVGPRVSFTRSGLAVPWDSRFKSLLELAEACAVPVRWSCRAGVCHACESELLGGAVCYDPNPLDQPAPGNLLLCCSTPFSEVKIDL